MTNISDKSAIKSFIIHSMRMLVLYPTIEPQVDTLFTKYKSSTLHICGDIFDEKVWRERKRNNSVIVNLYTKDKHSTLNRLRNLSRKFTVLNAWRERQRKKYEVENTGEGWLSILLYNLSLSTCIPNMNFLSYGRVKIALTFSTHKTMMFLT